MNEHIVKVGAGYRLVSKKTGKNLGTYSSKAGAEKRERQVQYFKHMGEDVGAAPTNSAGSGSVAGIGVGKDGEPGIKKFAGSRVFKVPTKNFVMARMLKRKYQRFEEYVGDANLSKEIAEYANKNYGAGIVLEDESTGAMMYLRYGNGK